jgi:hypothetical protein
MNFSFRVFPSRKSCASLKTTSFPAVSYQRAGTRRSSTCSTGFPDFHAFAQLPGFPGRFGLTFHRLESLLPVCPRPACGELVTVPLASPVSKLSSSRESVHVKTGLPHLNGRYSLGRFAPSEFFLLHLRASNPPEPEARTRLASIRATQLRTDCPQSGRVRPNPPT